MKWNISTFLKELQLYYRLLSVNTQITRRSFLKTQTNSSTTVWCVVLCVSVFLFCFFFLFENKSIWNIQTNIFCIIYYNNIPNIYIFELKNNLQVSSLLPLCIIRYYFLHSTHVLYMKCVKRRIVRTCE